MKKSSSLRERESLNDKTIVEPGPGESIRYALCEDGNVRAHIGLCYVFKFHASASWAPKSIPVPVIKCGSGLSAVKILAIA